MANILKVINGDINLSTGEFTQKYNHDCPIRTEFKSINYDTNVIEEYIKELVGSEQMTNFQRDLGAHLIKTQHVINIHGNGSCPGGKTTFIKLLNKLLGKDMSRSPSALITTDYYEVSSAELNTKIVFIGDLEGDDSIKWGKVKELTDSDEVVGRVPYGELQRGTFGNVLIESVTKLSPTKEDPGMLRRLKSYEFHNNFYTNPNKLEEIGLHLDQFLVWLVKGCISSQW